MCALFRSKCNKKDVAKPSTRFDLWNFNQKPSPAINYLPSNKKQFFCITSTANNGRRQLLQPFSLCFSPLRAQQWMRVVDELVAVNFHGNINDWVTLEADERAKLSDAPELQWIAVETISLSKCSGRNSRAEATDTAPWAQRELNESMNEIKWRWGGVMARNEGFYVERVKMGGKLVGESVGMGTSDFFSLIFKNWT